MFTGLIFLAVIIGSIIFHVWTPWWWTDIASNWSAMDDTIILSFWIGGGVFILVCLFMVYCIFRYQYKEGRRSEYKLEDKKFNERPSPYRERSCPSFQWGIHRYKPLIKVLRETIAEFAAYKVLKNNQATTDKLKHGLFPAKKVVVKNTKQLLLDLLADRISCLEKRENSPSGYFYFTSTHKISALSALKGEVEQADGNADFETIVSGWLDGNHSSINTEGVTNRSVINSNLFFFSTNLFSSKTETFIAEMNKILHDQTVSGNLPSSDINATPKQAKYSFKYSR